MTQKTIFWRKIILNYLNKTDFRVLYLLLERLGNFRLIT